MTNRRPPNCVANLRAGLENVRRWLKPGGRLILHTFPTLGPHTFYRMYLKATGRKADLAALDAIHCNVQTRKSLRNVLEEVDLNVEKIWLSNDVAKTSSVYHRLPNGFRKRVLGVVANDVLGHPMLCGALSLIGLAEFAAPSIYASCTRSV